MAESNGPPEEETVEGKPLEAAQPPVESKPAEAAENSEVSTVTRPLARDLYDWASRLTSEAGNGFEDYYWTPQMERLVTKLKLTKRALIGVIGVQGAGKSAAMRAIAECLAGEEGFGRDHVLAVKVPESGGLVDAFNTIFGPLNDKEYTRLEEMLDSKLAERVSLDSALQHRLRRAADRMGDEELVQQIEKGSLDELPFLKLRSSIPQRIIHELEHEALQQLLGLQRLIIIDMPDYPKHDRRLIARDLDDIQGLWNRLMAKKNDVSLVVFIQKETFSHADHFLYGKMDIIPLIPLTVTQLLEAYSRKWSGYAPFNEDALQYVAKMSRGVFRRFKRYIGLAVEMRIAEGAQADVSSTPIDLELVKKSVTDEEVMRDMDKEFDGIFRKREQKEKALELIKILSEPHIRAEQAKTADAKSLKELIRSDADSAPEGIIQQQLAWDLGLSEMAVSRLVRELEQHGYIKRRVWRQWTRVDMNW